MPFNRLDWYWIVQDKDSVNSVWSTSANAYVANSGAAFGSWLDVPSVHFGSGTPIVGASNNGSGRIRLQIDPSFGTNIVTGQRWRVNSEIIDTLPSAPPLTGLSASIGKWRVTKINNSTIDLDSSSYNSSDPWVSGGTLQGAAIAPTESALFAQLGIIAQQSDLLAYLAVASAVDVTLANPLSTWIDVTMSASGKAVTLAAMNSGNSPPPGKTFTVNNAGSIDFSLKDASGTLLTVLNPGYMAILTLLFNTTIGGTFQVRVVPFPTATTIHGSMQVQVVNNAGTPTTKLDISAAEVQFRGISIRTPLMASSVSATLDIGASGPVLNGRDRSAAFGAGATVHVFSIGGFGQTTGFIASVDATPNSSPPPLPQGYTHIGYIGSYILDASAHFFNITQFGSWVYYNADTDATVVTSGSATGATPTTAVSVAAVVPAVATRFELEALATLVSTAGGPTTEVLQIGFVSGVTHFRNRLYVQVASQTCQQTQAKQLPNVGQNFYYNWDGGGANTSTRAVTGLITGYECPNGGP